MSNTIEIDLTQDSEDDEDFEAAPSVLSFTEALNKMHSANSEVENLNADKETNNIVDKFQLSKNQLRIISDDEEETAKSNDITKLKISSSEKLSTSKMPHTDGKRSRPVFVQYNKSDCTSSSNESDDSDASDNVTDAWSELEDERGGQHESREGQEAIIKEQYKEAITALQGHNRQRAFKLFVSVLLNPLLQEFYVQNWHNFNWELAAIKSSRLLSNMSKVYFSVNLAIAGLVDDPVPFYMQALTIHPELTDIWYECGQEAAKRHDWLIAELCFTKCNDEFRAHESLLLLYFVIKDFFKCVPYMQSILKKCEDHCLAHVIRLEVSKSQSFWSSIMDKIFDKNICNKVVDISVTKLILEKIEHFRKKSTFSDCSSKKQNIFTDLIKKSKKSFSSFPLLIRTDMNMEELGLIVCDAFDRIEMFSLLLNQIVFVQEIVSTKPVENVIIVNEPINEFDAIFEAAIESDDLEEIKLVLNDMIANVELFVLEDEAKRKKLNKKKIINYKKAVSKSRRSEIDDSLLSEDELTRRRSTRFVEDVALNVLNGIEEEKQENEIMWSYMGININDYDKLQPFCFSTSVNAQRFNILNKNFDSISLTTLSSIHPLIQLFLTISNSSGKFIDYFLYTFLSYFSNEDGICQNFIFTDEQSVIYRHVYVRWVRTFATSTFENMTAKDLSVHLLAAEFNSPLALSVLQRYFLFMHFNQNVEEPLMNNTFKSDISSLFYTPTYLSNFINIEDKHLSCLFNRIVNDSEKNLQLFHQENAAVNESGLPTLLEKKNHVLMKKPNLNLSNNVLRCQEIRYRWLVSQLDSPEAVGFVAETPEYIIHRYTNLSEIAQIINTDEKFYSHIVNSKSSNCISLANVCGLLFEESKRLYARRIEHLKSSENYEELFDVLLSFYNFAEADENSQLETIFLLTKCAIKTGRFRIALESILAFSVFYKIRGNNFSSESDAKHALKKCIKLLNNINIFSLEESTLFGFGKSLIELLITSSESDILHSNNDLWLLCHSIAKHCEKLDVSELHDLYANGPNNCLPTKALMVLSKAHEVLGEAQKCRKFEGKFLRLFLNELNEAVCHPIVSKLLVEDCRQLILQNVAVETYQCLICVFSESFTKIRSPYEDHGLSKLEWNSGWDLAEVVLPLIMPRVLPDFTALEKVSSYFVDAVSRIFKDVLTINESAANNLRKFCSNPPKMELFEIYDADGLPSHCGEEYEIDGGKDPRTFLYVTPAKEENENKKLKLAAQCLYALSIAHYRNNNQDEALKMVRACLSICGSYLDDNLQSSAWFIFARCITNNYSMMHDSELLKNVDEFFLPFKMTIYLKKDSCDAHLDLATIMYQIRTRIKRFIKRGIDVTDDQKKIYHNKIEGMIPKCRTHFQLAQRYNDSVAEVPWLSAYFLAKIAEKLGNSPGKIFQLYYESAISMENEGYIYPPKIHRTKQVNFEPLEIHYKVHSYAYKQLNILKSRMKSNKSFKLCEILSTLKVFYANLKRFSLHAVEQKGGSVSDFYLNDVNKLLSDSKLGVLNKTYITMDIKDDFQNVLELDVFQTVSDIIDGVDLIESIQKMFMQAFETILFKFPHYKACYRIAERQYLLGLYRECSNTLFHRLFFNSKKRFTSSSNIFENIVEISRADIERSGSYPYHIHKIIDLSIVSAFKCHDIDRLFSVMNSLLTLKNDKNVPDMLDDKVVECLKRKCSTGIGSVISSLKNMQRMSIVSIQLQDIIRKINKNNTTDKKALEWSLQKLHQKQALFQQKNSVSNQERKLPNTAALKRSIQNDVSPIPAKTAHIDGFSIINSSEENRSGSVEFYKGAASIDTPTTSSSLLAFAASVENNYENLMRELRLIKNNPISRTASLKMPSLNSGNCTSEQHRQNSENVVKNFKSDDLASSSGIYAMLSNKHSRQDLPASNMNLKIQPTFNSILGANSWSSADKVYTQTAANLNQTQNDNYQTSHSSSFTQADLNVYRNLVSVLSNVQPPQTISTPAHNISNERKKQINTTAGLLVPSSNSSDVRLSTKSSSLINFPAKTFSHLVSGDEFKRKCVLNSSTDLSLNQASNLTTSKHYVQINKGNVTNSSHSAGKIRDKNVSSAKEESTQQALVAQKDQLQALAIFIDEQLKKLPEDQRRKIVLECTQRNMTVADTQRYIMSKILSNVQQQKSCSSSVQQQQKANCSSIQQQQKANCSSIQQQQKANCSSVQQQQKTNCSSIQQQQKANCLSVQQQQKANCSSVQQQQKANCSSVQQQQKINTTLPQQQDKTNIMSYHQKPKSNVSNQQQKRFSNSTQQPPKSNNTSSQQQLQSHQKRYSMSTEKQKNQSASKNTPQLTFQNHSSLPLQNLSKSQQDVLSMMLKNNLQKKTIENNQSSSAKVNKLTMENLQKEENIRKILQASRSIKLTKNVENLSQQVQQKFHSTKPQQTSVSTLQNVLKSALSSTSQQTFLCEPSSSSFNSVSTTMPSTINSTLSPKQKTNNCKNSVNVISAQQQYLYSLYKATIDKEKHQMASPQKSSLSVLENQSILFSLMQSQARNDASSSNQQYSKTPSQQKTSVADAFVADQNVIRKQQMNALVNAVNLVNAQNNSRNENKVVKKNSIVQKNNSNIPLNSGIVPGSAEWLQWQKLLKEQRHN